MKFYKLKSLLLYNSLFFFFLLLVELILGRWHLLGTPVTKIPAAPFAMKIKRDVRKIYGLKRPYYISNIRDKKGYRSSKDYKQNDIVLT